MKQIQLVGFFALVLTLIACGQAQQKEIETEENWKSLDKKDYSIQYPDTFELDTSGQMGMDFILFSKKSSQQDSFRENVGLLIQDLTGQNIDLDKYVEISEEQINTMITNSKIIASKRVSKNNKEYQRVIYTGKQGQFDLKWQQFYWVENKKAFVLTLTCEENKYDKYSTVGKAIMKTFVIK